MSAPFFKQDDDSKIAEISAAALLLLVEPRLRQAVLRSIAVMRSMVGTEQQIAEAIRTGQIHPIIDNMARAGAVTLANEIADSYTLAGTRTAEDLTDGLLVTVDFDRVNERAVEHMRQTRLGLIRDFTDEQREVAQRAMTRGIEQGANPLVQAREFRGDIGLTVRQQQAVDNYRRSLALAGEGDRLALDRELRDRRFDPTVQRAINTREPLTQAQIDRMVQRYKERFIRQRSETIARTEALRSVHSGQHESLLQAVEDGVVDQHTLVREWNTSIDGRERESHNRLNGVKRGLHETFPGLDGPLRYPGDPFAPASEVVRCRCALSARVQSLEGLNAV